MCVWYMWWSQLCLNRDIVRLSQEQVSEIPFDVNHLLKVRRLYGPIYTHTHTHTRTHTCTCATYTYTHTHVHTHSLHTLTQSKSVSQFDERLTAPLFGYPTVDDYYRAARNSDKLHKICIPYICLTATDDPFVPDKCKIHFV